MQGVTSTAWTAIAGTDMFNRTKIRAELQSCSPCAFPKTATSNEVQLSVGSTGVNTKDLLTISGPTLNQQLVWFTLKA